MKNTNNWRSRWKDTTGRGKEIVDIYTENSGDAYFTINGVVNLGGGVIRVIGWSKDGKDNTWDGGPNALLPLNKVVVSEEVFDAWVNSVSFQTKVALAEIITTYLKENNIPIPSPITRPSDGASY